jgi:hypothetical protein
MINENNVELIKLLHTKITQEEERYVIALKEEWQSWELKQIQDKITDLQKCIEEISSVSPGLRRSF